MLYRVKVFEDGDIFVCKVVQKLKNDDYLYFSSTNELVRELLDYGVTDLEEDITAIMAAPVNEEIRCY
jgi:hypothetical protein